MQLVRTLGVALFWFLLSYGVSHVLEFPLEKTLLGLMLMSLASAHVQLYSIENGENRHGKRLTTHSSTHTQSRLLGVHGNVESSEGSCCQEDLGTHQKT